MKLIKVDAIGSTNSFLKEGLRDKMITESTCIWAVEQTDGRGQMGTNWKSEMGKNLTFSVCFLLSEDFSERPFVISMLTAIALQKVLTDYKTPGLKIKWPNDILSVKKKIGGVLIENTYHNGVLSETVIGIGLNINQEKFDALPKASSLKLILGRSLPLEEILNKILSVLENSIKNYTALDFELVKEQYEKLLFRNKKPSTFINVEGDDFVGIIQGVSPNGHLAILEEDAVINHYDLKQVVLKY